MQGKKKFRISVALLFPPPTKKNTIADSRMYFSTSTLPVSSHRSVLFGTARYKKFNFFNKTFFLFISLIFHNFLFTSLFNWIWIGHCFDQIRIRQNYQIWNKVCRNSGQLYYFLIVKVTHFVNKQTKQIII